MTERTISDSRSVTTSRALYKLMSDSAANGGNVQVYAEALGEWLNAARFEPGPHNSIVAIIDAKGSSTFLPWREVAAVRCNP